MQLALSFNFWKNGLEAKNTISTYSNKIYKIFSQVPEEERILLLFFKRITLNFFSFLTLLPLSCLYILFYSAINKKKHSFKKQNVKYKTPTRPIHDIFNFFFFIILRNQRNKPLKENLKKIAFYSSMEKKVIITYQKIVPSLL